MIRIGIHRGDAEIRALHSEWGEERVLHEVFPAALRDLAAEIAGRHEHQVVVLKLDPQIAAELEKWETMIHLFPSEVGPVPESVMTGEPRAMSDEIARSQVRRRVFIVHPKIGQVLADRFVPIEFSLP